jgi:hypothetical protein
MVDGGWSLGRLNKLLTSVIRRSVLTPSTHAFFLSHILTMHPMLRAGTITRARFEQLAHDVATSSMLLPAEYRWSLIKTSAGEHAYLQRDYELVRAAIGPTNQLPPPSSNNQQFDGIDEALSIADDDPVCLCCIMQRDSASVIVVL